jgi:hypothetical protein
MADWAREHLTAGQVFNKSAPAQWFAQHYPKIKRATVNMHVEGMSVNSANRKHHPSIKPGSGHDLFYKLGPDQFRLWDAPGDPVPVYKETLESQSPSEEDRDTLSDGPGGGQTGTEAGREFAFERDLRNYLVKI